MDSYSEMSGNDCCFASAEAETDPEICERGGSGPSHSLFPLLLFLFPLPPLSLALEVVPLKPTKGSG